jgi:hypothetical protein
VSFAIAVNKERCVAMSSRFKEIERIAYLLAEEAGFPEGQDLSFWLAAEKEYDRNLVATAKEPRQIYRAFAERFFSRADIDWADHEHVAKQYLHDSLEYPWYFASLPGTAADRADRIYDVALLSGDSELDDLSKRSLLLTDTSLLGIDGDAYNTFHEEVQYESVVYGRKDSTYWRSNVKDLSGLGRWLISVRPSLLGGDLFFLPKAKKEEQSYNDWKMENYRSETVGENFFFDAIIRERRVKKIWTPKDLKAEFIRFLAEIPVPIIEGLSMEDFVKVYYDENDSACKLKYALREHFFSLDLAATSEHSEEKLLKIGNKIAKDASKAVQDIEFITRKQAVIAAGAVFTTALGILAAVDMASLGQFAALIGGAGGAGGLLGAVQQEFVKRKARNDNPYTFFWLLSRVKST